MRIFNLWTSAEGITVTYVAATIAWITLTDQAAEALFPDVQTLTMIQSLKGFVFVLLSGLVIYMMIRGLRKRLRRKTELLASAEAQVMKLFEDGLDAELLLDPATYTCRSANGAARRMLEHPSRTLDGRKVSDCMIESAADGQAADKEIEVAFSGAMRGNAQPVVWRLRGRDDTEIICSVTLTPAALDGQTLIRARLSDMTERYEADQILSLFGDGHRSSVGADFLEALAADLSRMPHLDYAIIAMADHDDSRVVALAHAGEVLEGLGCSFSASPLSCATDCGTRIIHSDVRNLLPSEKFLSAAEIEGLAAKPLFAADGNALGAICVMSREPLPNTGITERLLDIAADRAAAELERLQIESELRANEIRFRSLIDEASQAIIVHDQSRAIYANQAFADMAGFSSPEDVLKLDTIDSLIDKRDHQRLAEYNKARLVGEDAPSRYQFTGRRLDGTAFEVEARVVRVPWGDRMVTCANMFDITDQTNMRMALQRSEAAFRGLVEGSVQGFLIVSGKRLTFANAAAARMFGYESVDKMVAEGRAEELFPDCYRHGASGCALTHTGEDASAAPTEMRCLTHDGKELWVNLLANGIEWGGAAAIQITMQDISLAKRSEAALRRSQRMEAIGKLSGGVAHDFNNLLGIILGNLEFLSDSIDPDAREAVFVSNALQATNRGAQLTRRLLGFAASTPNAKSIIDINDALKGLEDILSRSLTREIELDFQPKQGLWSTEVDSGDFCDAIVNLALNARDAMPKGGRLVIETNNETLNAAPVTAEDLPPGDYVTATITDTGCGIAPEYLEKVFEPFFSSKSGTKGTGLGLSMVYGFVKRSNGGIKLFSEVGQGSTFKIFLPRQAEQAAKGALKSVKQKDALPRGTETVLVVDDETDLREVVCERLSALGYTVLAASDGKTALQVLERNPQVRLLLSDVIMPGGINGFALAESAVALYPGLGVLLVSGFTGRLSAEIERNDRSDYRLLAKPYNLRQLADNVREILDQTYQTDELSQATA